MSELTRVEIQAKIDNNIVENDAFEITAQEVAEILTDINDSYANLGDDQKAVQFASVDVIDDPVGYQVDGVTVVVSQQPHETDASAAHDLNATFNDTEVEAALDALGTKINALLDILESHGLMAVAP